MEQKIRSFTGDENGQTRAPADDGNNIFILFDTSNSMCLGFAQFEDNIAEFIRSLGNRDRLAVSTFCRNLHRGTPLMADHAFAIGKLREAVAGDETMLYDAILLTLRDASAAAGRSTLVVFSNGPDDHSMLTPADVGRVAEEAGIPIYVVSTNLSDQATRNALMSLTQRTGGDLHVAHSAAGRRQAFGKIGQAIRHTYELAYIPSPNQNQAFRKIDVRISGGSSYRVQARAGYIAR